MLRVTLLAFVALAVGAVVALYVASDRTDEAFAWTIQPPLTAALMGAGYAGALVLFGVTAATDDWTRVRSAIPAPFVLSVAMLATTLLHLDRFHLGRGGVPGVVAWIWLVVYVVVPPLLAFAWVRHRRRPVARPGRPLPPWSVALGWTGALVSAVIGAALLVAPEAGAVAAWPWELTPLTARALGSWLVGGAAAQAHVVLDGDLVRVRPLLAALTTTGLFGLGALGRFPAELQGAGAGVLVAGLAVLTVVAGAGLWGTRGPSR